MVIGAWVTCLFFEILLLHALVCSFEDLARSPLGLLGDRFPLLLLLLIALVLLVIGHVDLKVSEADPHLDVASLVEKTLVQLSRTIVLALFFLKVDVCLP